jgi:hypothetical protein
VYQETIKYLDKDHSDYKKTSTKIREIQKRIKLMQENETNNERQIIANITKIFNY